MQCVQTPHRLEGEREIGVGGADPLIALTSSSRTVDLMAYRPNNSARTNVSIVSQYATYQEAYYFGQQSSIAGSVFCAIRLTFCRWSMASELYFFRHWIIVLPNTTLSSPTCILQAPSSFASVQIVGCSYLAGPTWPEYKCSSTSGTSWSQT